MCRDGKKQNETKQRCADDVRHDYLLMKPVSRISNQARREEDGESQKEENRSTG